jgi:hypothetical protein
MIGNAESLVAMERDKRLALVIAEGPNSLTIRIRMAVPRENNTEREPIDGDPQSTSEHFGSLIDQVLANYRAETSTDRTVDGLQISVQIPRKIAA